MLAKDFKIRASKSHDISTHSGLTNNQETTLKDFMKRKAGEGKPLTANQEDTLKELLFKRDNPELPKGCKTYAKNWIKEKLYGRRKEMSNKYTDKGNFNELDALDLVSRYFKVDLTPFYTTEYKSNDYSEGTCDINHPSIGIIDIKNSWDLSTFPMFEDVIPDEKYINQANTYQDLYKNYNKAHIAYVLTDCPLHILEQELRWLETDDEKQRKSNTLIYTSKGWFEAKENFFPNAEPFEFIEIPRKNRIKVFSFDWNPKIVENRKKRVEEIRNYIKELVN